MKKLCIPLAAIVCSCAAMSNIRVNYSLAIPAHEIYEPYKKNEQCEMRGENGEKIKVKAFYKLSMSGKKARKYVEDVLEELRKKQRKEWDNIDIAVRAIDLVLADLDIVNGNGYYTSKHEKSERQTEIEVDLKFLKEKVFIASLPDSTQTLDTFLSHESGKYEGDCDDFAAALLTAYGLMKTIAKEKKQDAFYSKLYDGLQQYKIIGVDVEGTAVGHAMNASILFSNDFSVAFMRAIEPQGYSRRLNEKRYFKDEIVFEKETFYVVRRYNDGTKTKMKVRRFIDFEVCYELPLFLK